MRKNLGKKLGAVLLGCAVSVGGALAAQEGLVNVNVEDIRADIAKDINVDVSQIPVTVQAPIGVAANVCNVAANVLGRQDSPTGGSCDAKSTNEALNNLVQKQIKGQQ